MFINDRPTTFVNNSQTTFVDKIVNNDFNDSSINGGRQKWEQYLSLKMRTMSANESTKQWL